MKKLLLSFSFALAFASAQAQQPLYSFGFDSDLEAAGWITTNQSTPATETIWSLADYEPTVVTAATPGNPFSDQEYETGETSPAPQGQEGGNNSFAIVNYTSTSGTGTISNWLITPTVTVQNGDVVSFYTRLGSMEAEFADNLQFRMSTEGEASIIPSEGSDSLGNFTTLLTEINPDLDLESYPTTWTMYSVTMSGLSAPTAVRFGFRYFVTDGGPTGDNSDIIGLDSFAVNNALGTNDFFAANFALYPNPANDVVTISANNATAINGVTVTDMNGRIVKQQNMNGISAGQIAVSDLNAGVYFVSVQTALGKGTAKFVKM